MRNAKRASLLLACSVLLFGGLAACGAVPKDMPASSGSLAETGSLEEPEGGEQSLAERMDLVRRRVALRSIIRKGDYYKSRNDALTALSYYKSALERNPKDPMIALKLAWAQTELKQYRDAYENYRLSAVSTLDEKTKLHYIDSIMLDPNRTDKTAIVEKLPFEPGTKEYYSLVDACSKSPSTCIATIRSSTSTEPRIRDLRSIVAAQISIGSEELYQNVLIAAKFFEQRSFLASRELAKIVTGRRPDYRVAVKLLGYSEYELGDYKAAAIALEKYHALEPKDIDILYTLGIISYLREDYSTSNLYFNAAILWGYSPKTELERRLIYNYTLLGDSKGAFKIFRYLLDEADVSGEDFEIAVFLALQTDEISKASLWSAKGIEKFGSNDRIIALAGNVLRIRGEYDDAETLLRRALSMDGRNPVASLELGRIFVAKKEYTIAKGYFEDAVRVDAGGFFGDAAAREIELLPIDPIVLTGSVSTGSTDSWIITPSL